MDVVEVVPFSGMDDENAIKHLEARHALALDGIGLAFRVPVPGRPLRIRGSRRGWDIWHDREHERGEADDHEH